MCWNCGIPWYSAPRPTLVAEPPVKEETVYLDSNPGWYKDERKAPPYYTYRDPFPATLNHPDAVQVESSEDWPRTYRANPNYTGSQGIHPPGPVYPNNWQYQYQYQYPTTGSYAAWQGYTGAPASYSNMQSWWPQYAAYMQQYTGQAPQYGSYGYWVNGQYYGVPQPTVPGGPMVLPATDCTQTQIQQAHLAAATNAALATMPQAPNYYVGGGMTDWATQQSLLARQYGWGKAQPSQLFPYKPSDGQQFWCKELDGTWTLRTHSDIINGDVDPKQWMTHPTSGYWYVVRTG